MDGKEIKIMKIYGYKENSNEFVELSEASIECTMDELKKITKFFLEIYEQHKKTQGKTEYCHSHYRDWDEDWNENGSDLIVISTFDK